MDRYSFKEGLQTARIVVRNGNEVVTTITDTSIKSGGLVIDRYSTSAATVQLGTTIAAECAIALDNADGTFNSLQRGQEIDVYIAIDGEELEMGHFVILAVTKYQNELNIQALDYMVYFDFQSNVSLTSTSTIRSIIQGICTYCGVEVDINTIPTTKITSAKFTEICTYRNVISYLAELAGAVAYFTPQGKLAFGWYSSQGLEINSDVRFSSDISDTPLKIVSAKISTDAVSAVEIDINNNVTLNIVNNPYTTLMSDSEKQSIETTVTNKVKIDKLYNATATILPIPTLMPLEIVSWDGEKPVAITRTTFTLNRNMFIEGLADGTSDYSNGLAQSIATTKGMATNAQAAADTAKTAADNAQATADTANTAATNAQNTADSATTAASNAQQSANEAKALATTANSAVTALDDSLTQQEIFNRLTDNGAAEGIYLEDGNLYINGTYIKSGVVDAGLIKAGILTDEKGKNYWNLKTGEFSLTGYATDDELSAVDTKAGNAKTAADNAQSTADTAITNITNLNNSLTQQEIFNRLTNNGAAEGIYLENGKLYINGTYIQSGVIDAALIKAGILKDEKGKNYWNLKTGEFSLTGYATDSELAEVDTKAGNAATAASNAQTTANTANSTANTAKTNAATAQSTADAAKANAATAQSTANTALAQSVEYIIGTQTASTNAWTGVTTDSSIKAGKSIAYYLPYAGTSTAATLNLTLSGGGTTGAKPVLMNTSAVTTHYPVGTVIKMTYDGTNWKTDNFNSDTINRTKFQAVLTAAEAITAGRIICGTASGYRNIAAAVSFDLSYPLLYAITTIAKGATSGTRDNNFLEINGITFSNNGTITAGAANKTIYLKGTVTGNTFKIAASPFLTTTVPTSADNFYYIPLGIMTSATVGYFNSSNRLYAYLDGAFQAVDTAAKLLADKAQTTANAANSAVTALNNSLTQQEIFNRLTNSGKAKGIYLENGELYINGTYIKSGVVDAALVKAGILTDSKGKNFWNLETGEFSLTNATIDGYATDSELAQAVSDISIGGRNFFKWSDTPSKWNLYAPTAYLIARVLLYENLENGKQYTITIWGDTPTRSDKTNTWYSAYWGGGNVKLGDVKIGSEGKGSITFKPNSTHADTANSWINIYNTPMSASGVTYTANITKIKLEKGNKSTDWTPAPEDADTELANFATKVTGDISDLQNQIDGNITTWYYNYVPTLSNAPASTWTTTALKNNHIGDLFYNSATGYAYRFMLDGSTYKWVRIADTDITSALNKAQAAQDTADNKRRVFINQPTVPYDVGDLWYASTTSEVKVCTTARATGSYTASDWVKRDKYTDDTTANAAKTTANTALNRSTYHYGTCATAAATVAKVVTLTNFELYTGAQVYVYFTNANTATAPTLNVNSTGAKAIWAKGATLAAKSPYNWTAKSLVGFTYNGTQWVMTAEDQAETFNRLTNSGALEGIYMSDGKLYINGSYIQAGTIDANLVKTGIIADQSGKNYINLDTGEISIFGYATDSDLSAVDTKAGNAATAASNAQTTANSASTAASNAQSSANLAKLVGTCATAAGTAAKVVACTDCTALSTGMRITITFTNANTVSDAITLNVNSKGAKTVYVSGGETSATNQLLWAAGAQITFVYDGTYFVPVGYQSTLQGSSTTAAATAAKVMTYAKATIAKGSVANVYFSNANTVASPTLNISSTGAKAIWAEGAALTATSKYNWTAKSSVALTFNGAQWVIGEDTSAVTTAAAAQSTANTAKSTADTAKTNADTAKSTAETAKSTADTAKSTADTAKTTATTAKTTADTAKSTADTAKSTADTAKTTANTALSQSVEYIIGTQTEATNAWTGVTTDASIKAGKNIAYYLPQAGTSSAATLNLTLSGGSTTGAKNVRINNSNVTTHYPAGTVIKMTYDGTYWKTDNYNSDTINRTKFQAVLTAAAAITAGRIICGTASGYKNIAASTAFDLAYPLLYAGTAIDKGATSGTRDNNYLEINGITFSSNGTITSGAAGKTIYLKGTVSGNTFTTSASPFLTTVTPTSADNFYYIPLGLMTSATVGYFNSSNRLYAYLNGAFQAVDTAAKLLADKAQTTANTASTNATTALSRATYKYGTCSTAAATAEKAVTITNFPTALYTGAQISVYFTNANTAASPTLKINSLDAKPIYAKGAALAAAYYWSAKSMVNFTYNGSQWVMEVTDTTETFNRLTNSGTLKGIYKSGNELYINASYIKTGELNADLIKSGTINAIDISGSSIDGAKITSSGAIYEGSSVIGNVLIQKGYVDLWRLIASKGSSANDYYRAHLAADKIELQTYEAVNPSQSTVTPTTAVILDPGGGISIKGFNATMELDGVEGITYQSGGQKNNWSLKDGTATLDRWIIENGLPISADEDLNTYYTRGLYYCAASADAKTLTNTPITASSMVAFTMRVGYATGNGYPYQLLQRYDTGKQYYRYKTTTNATNNWTAWREVAPNTTYSAMTQSEATTGTATTGRLITAAVLNNTAVKYAAGDTVTITSGTLLAGDVTSATKTVRVFLPLPKSPAGRTATISTKPTSVSIRGTQGYFEGGDARNLTGSDYTWSTSVKNTGILISIVKSSAAFTNATNNTPLSMQLGANMVITFS